MELTWLLSSVTIPQFQDVMGQYVWSERNFLRDHQFCFRRFFILRKKHTKCWIYVTRLAKSSLILHWSCTLPGKMDSFLKIRRDDINPKVIAFLGSYLPEKLSRIKFYDKLLVSKLIRVCICQGSSVSTSRYATLVIFLVPL